MIVSLSIIYANLELHQDKQDGQISLQQKWLLKSVKLPRLSDLRKE